jgi:TPR repeat protein
MSTEKESNLFKEADKEWDAGNLKNAYKLFLECAKEGDTSCQNNLGIFFESGLAVKKDVNKALYWYKKSVKGDAGSAASENIGDLYLKRGNIRRARYWFKKAIDAGSGDAMLEMAKTYYHARDTKRNRKLAMKYILEALEKEEYKGITPNGLEEAMALKKALDDRIRGQA